MERGAALETEHLARTRQTSRVRPTEPAEPPLPPPINTMSYFSPGVGFSIGAILETEV
jgi:hypothetical protein